MLFACSGFSLCLEERAVMTWIGRVHGTLKQAIEKTVLFQCRKWEFYGPFLP